MAKLSRAVRSVRSRLYGAFDCAAHIIAVHEYRVIYVSIPKVANTSVKTLLQELIPETREFTTQYSYDPDDNTIFQVPEVRERLRDRNVMLCKHNLRRYRHYVRFAFVRNPFTRLVSCYNQKIRPWLGVEQPTGGAVLSVTRAGFDHRAMSFAEFARAVSKIPDAQANRHYRSQSAFLTDRRQRLLVSEFYHLENMEHGFDRLRQLLHLDVRSLPHQKNTGTKSVAELYDDTSRRLVAERFARDFELLGYDPGRVP